MTTVLAVLALILLLAAVVISIWQTGEITAAHVGLVSVAGVGLKAVIDRLPKWRRE